MQIIRNERRIRFLTTVGQYVPWVALLVLAGGLAVSYLRPEWLFAMLIAVVVGVTLSAVGGRFAERYAGPLAHHKALRETLKGLDRHHALAQYVLPAPHVLFDRGGATVLVVKSHSGAVTFADGRFKHHQKGRVFRQLAGQESIGLAHEEALASASKVEAWLEKHVPAGEVPVRAAMVFVHPGAKIEAADSPVPVFYGKKIKNWLRGPGRRKALPSDVYRSVLEALHELGAQTED